MAVTFFFLLPGYYRGGGSLKSKMLTRKMTLNGSGLKRRIIDLLWLVEEGEGGKKYIFLSTGVPPRANKRPRKVNNTYFMPSTCVCVNVT